MILTVDGSTKPKWIKKDSAEILQDEDFLKIIEFYVYNTPCLELSARGISFSDYGWYAPSKKPWSVSLHLAQEFEKTRYLSCVNTYEKLFYKLKEFDWILNFGNDIQEKAVFYKTKRKEIVAYNLLYHLRNCLAHGRFERIAIKGEVYFIFEDVNNVTINKNRYDELTMDGKTITPKLDSTKIVTARMILRKNTLLKWISIIKSGQTVFVSRSHKH